MPLVKADGREWVTTLPLQVKAWYKDLIKQRASLESQKSNQPSPTDYSKGYLEGRIEELDAHIRMLKNGYFPEVTLED